jgi:5-methyltetrahydrofolate--homocysteine methyltransferase
VKARGYDVIDLGVMVSSERILEAALEHKVAIIGLSGLITPSLDEMVHVASEMERRGIRTPLLIGGATTSRAHTAVKIEPVISSPVVHVHDASRAVGVVSKLLSENMLEYAADIRAEYAALRAGRAERQVRLVTLEEARARAPKLEFGNVIKPKMLGRAELDFTLEELREFIDWTPFFIAWELKGVYPTIFDDPTVGKQATELFNDAQTMLRTIMIEKSLQARAVVGCWRANSSGDDIVLRDDTGRKISSLHTLRQQRDQAEPNRALSDYISPVGEDYVGAFAVTIHGADQLAKAFELEHDDYNSILVKSLADRLAEALAEKLHADVRRTHWGYAPNEVLSNREMIREKYTGIRPAPGYPAQPDHTEKHEIFKLLEAKKIGLELTESFAMLPASSVSGLYFAHPESKYFAVARIGEDQVADYAKRKNMSVSEVERWLGPNLAYTPERTSEHTPTREAIDA